MMNNYLNDILIMMLNIIASYKKLLYAIINTLKLCKNSSFLNLKSTDSTGSFVGGDYNFLS